MTHSISKKSIFQVFLRDFIGKKTKSPRWKACVNFVTSKLIHSTGAIYVRNRFSKVGTASV